MGNADGCIPVLGFWGGARHGKVVDVLWWVDGEDFFFPSMIGRAHEALLPRWHAHVDEKEHK